MNNLEAFLLGAAAGAGAMYLLDPDQGRRRRALARDQLSHGRHTLEDTMSERARDAANRARGAVAETRARFRGEDVDDSVLEARIRSELGHHVHNAGALHVYVREGRVTLSGPVLAGEVQEVVRAVRRLPGVGHVENALEVHAAPGGVPGLQGPEG